MKCCDLSAGKLRHVISFEREARTADGGGGTSLVWATIANGTARAFVKPTSGTESVYAQRIEARITHRVYIRYRSDLLASDRINFGGRLMQIKALINIEERDRWLEITVEEGVAT